jgi:hypothetical protein
MREGIWVPSLLHRSGETFWGKAAQNRKDIVPKEAITILEAQVNRAIIKKLIDSIPVPERPKKKARRASAVKTQTDSVRKNSFVCTSFMKNYEFLPVCLPRLFLICTYFSCFVHFVRSSLKYLRKNMFLLPFFQGHMMTLYPLSPTPLLYCPPSIGESTRIKRKHTSIIIMNLLMIR